MNTFPLDLSFSAKDQTILSSINNINMRKLVNDNASNFTVRPLDNFSPTYEGTHVPVVITNIP